MALWSATTWKRGRGRRTLVVQTPYLALKVVIDRRNAGRHSGEATLLARTGHFESPLEIPSSLRSTVRNRSFERLPGCRLAAGVLGGIHRGAPQLLPQFPFPL